MKTDASLSDLGIDVEFEFDQLKKSFDEGNNACALHALAFSLYFDAKPPEWAIKHLNNGYQRWHYAEVRTLDEALGIERPKGFRLDAAKRNAMHAAAIMIEVNKRLQQESYDDEIFEEVGKIWGLGKTATKEIYTAQMKSIELSHPETYKRMIASRKKRKKPALTVRASR